MEIVLKKEAADMVVGYNNSAAPLGQRTDHAELLDVVIGPGDVIRDTYIASFFEKLPTRAQLDEYKTKKTVEKAGTIKKKD